MFDNDIVGIIDRLKYISADVSCPNIDIGARAAVNVFQKLRPLTWCSSSLGSVLFKPSHSLATGIELDPSTRSDPISVLDPIATAATSSNSFTAQVILLKPNTPWSETWEAAQDIKAPGPAPPGPRHPQAPRQPPGSPGPPCPRGSPKCVCV